MTFSNWQETESDARPMRLFVSVPAGSGLFPGMVVMQHQGGVDGFIQQMTQRLAQAGYIAAAPDLYHRDGPDCQDDIVTRRSRLSDRRIVNDVAATVAFLQSHSAVDGDRLGVIGFCMGGRLAYLTVTANPAFKAAVAFYPGNTFRPWGRDLPSPFERTAEIHCPVQAHFGADDANPSPQDMAKLDAELTRFAKPHEFFAYSNAGHAFMDKTKESYRGHADEAAWPRTLEFLDRHLHRVK
ncbi:MAG: dienelactone hydrolase family protein [Candidatus Binatia bacterium]